VNVTPLRVGPPVLLPHEKALARRCLIYGITPEQYKKMLLLQRGLCAICSRPPKKRSLNIDHDHATQRVRGLLCFICNRLVLARGIGPALLRAAADYYERDFDARKL
jgi:hypothetical protein